MTDLHSDDNNSDILSEDELNSAKCIKGNQLNTWAQKERKKSTRNQQQPLQKNQYG